ncbi:MAG: ATP-binding protein [Desulfatitalea sp.]
MNPFQNRLSEKLVESLVAPIPAGTPRQVFGAINLNGKATAVIGMRRAGKTVFLHQLRREHQAGGMDQERMPYINFEDERLVELTAENLHPLVEDYYRRFPGLRGQETVMWCFDEIQTVPGWERFVRRLLDSEKVELYLTGSSAALLSREIATALRGRAWEVVVHPFSFKEVLRHKRLPLPERPDFLGAPERSLLERAFLDYLEAGGFPEAQGLDTATRYQLLKDYVDVAMFRDVVERHTVSNVVGLRWMVRHLLGNAAGVFSVEKFYGALKSQGVAISKDTVHQLMFFLQDCFLVRTVWMEAASERQRMVNPRKAYPVDPGLIPVFDRTGRANTGHALETAVLLELERRRAEISYVKTSQGFEVDFLARYPSGQLELIQVCADAGTDDTAQRELRALEEAGRQFPKAFKRLLTLTQDGLPREAPAGVLAQPAYVWMLTPPEATGGR